MGKILIVEDLGFTRNMVKCALNENGYTEVLEADSAEKAIGLLHSDSPDLVILDINLPDRKDLSLLEEIKTEKPAVKVIMHTAVSQPVVMNRAKELGAEMYMVKPADKSEIAEAVGNVLAM